MGYEQFMATADEATKAVYAATLSEMDSSEFRKATRYEYATTLAFWGMLEEKIETIYDASGKHIRGSRTRFRKVQ